MPMERESALKCFDQGKETKLKTKTEKKRSEKREISQPLYTCPAQKISLTAKSINRPDYLMASIMK